MNSYEVTLLNKTSLTEAVSKGLPDGDDVSEYCKIVKVDVPAYLIGVGVSDFLDSHLRSHGFIKEGWEMSEYRKVK